MGARRRVSSPLHIFFQQSLQIVSVSVELVIQILEGLDLGIHLTQQKVLPFHAIFGRDSTGNFAAARRTTSATLWALSFFKA